MTVYKKYFERNKGRVFPIYAYSPPHEGKWWIGDKIFPTEDFRTVERYKEYKECGFNILFLQHTALYKGEDWNTSQTKRCLDMAKEAGIDKVILVDERIFRLSCVEGGIVGEGKQFATESELDDFLRDCIKEYKNHEVFFGVQLVDEPFFVRLKSVCEVISAMKRVDSNVFVHCNLNPITNATLTYRFGPGGKNLVEAYENYIKTFLEWSGSDYVMVDTYPYMKQYSNTSINQFYFLGLEILARVCKEYDVELHIVMQSFAMNIGYKPYHLMPNRQMMQYQKNVLMAYGIKELSYFTYWTKQANSSEGEMFIDGKAMMTRLGEKTETYYHAQEINREFCELFPLLSDFKYSSHTILCTPPLFSRPVFYNFVQNGDLKQVKEAKTDREVALVTEQYDKKRRQYLLSVVNVSDPKLYRKTYKKQKQKTELTFIDKYDIVDLYLNGKWQTKKLKEGKLTVSLYPGEGIMILPYKEKK